MNGIILDDLPPVICDAVIVTRICGVRYLCFDSPCICQDDGQEWESEAARMVNVYGGSVFTVSALSSPNFNTHVLEERNFRAIPVGNVVLSYGT